MIHIDIKKLGRFGRPGHRITGSRKSKSLHRGVDWEYVHVAVDDTSRVAFNQIHPDEKAPSAVEHLKACVAYYTRLGITVRRVMTDNVLHSEHLAGFGRKASSRSFQIR